MKYLILSILLLLVGISHADPEIIQASPRYCKPGPEFQPNGLFAIYTFCDDALGTNIAIYLYKLGSPINGRCELGKLFWQDEEWSYDVTSWEIKDGFVTLEYEVEDGKIESAIVAM